MIDKEHILKLVVQAKRGSHASMKSLYDLYVLDMLTTSKRITGSIQDAEDIVQESFITAFSKLDKLKDGSKFRAWLKQIVVNNSLLLIRNKISWKDITNNEYPDKIEDDKWYEGVDLDIINDAIDKLSDGARQVFTLYLFEGYKHREIANMLQIALSTSKSQYRYALKQLKADLIKYKR